MKCVMSLIGLVLLASTASACDYGRACVAAQANVQYQVVPQAAYAVPQAQVQLVYPAARAYVPQAVAAPQFKVQRQFVPAKVQRQLAPVKVQRQQVPVYAPSAALAPAATGGVQQNVIIDQSNQEQQRRGLLRRLFNRR